MRHFSRRDFLASTTVAVASAVAHGAVSTSSRAAEIVRKPSPLPIVIFSKVYQELNLNFEDAAALTSEAGLNGVDSPVRPRGEILPERVADDLPRYAAILKKRGLTLPLLTTAILSPASPHAEEILRIAKKV